MIRRTKIVCTLGPASSSAERVEELLQRVQSADSTPARVADDWARSKRTSVTNGQGYCAACNYAKQAPGWHTQLAADQTTIITTTPTGHRYDSPVPTPPGARPPGPVPRANEDPGSPVEQQLRELLGLAA